MNKEDFITINVPLLIRLLEWAHEDCKSDVEIHNLVQKAIELSLNNDKLEMQDYENLLGNITESYGRNYNFNIDSRNKQITIQLPYKQSITFRNDYYFLNGKENNFRRITKMMAILLHDLFHNPQNPEERIFRLKSLVTNDI